MPAELAIELAMLLRQIRLFSDTPPLHRSRLFRVPTPAHAGRRRVDALRASPADLRPDLRTLMRVATRRAPDHREIAEACRAVATWAQGNGFARTAVHFAEAGAAAAPRDPHAAFIAGRTNRAVGTAWRAEIYYLRAIRKASRVRDLSTLTRAHLGLGNLFAHTGRLPQATDHFASAATTAMDCGEEWLAAQTYHDIMGLYFELDDLETALKFGQKALAAYPIHNERHPVAVHDIAVLLILKNQFTEAMMLLDLISPAPLPYEDQVLVAGSVSRAAGGLNQRDRYEAAQELVLHLGPQHDHHLDKAYVNLGFGAHALGDFELARDYAERALQVAVAKEHSYVVALSHRLMEDIDNKRPAHVPAPPLSGERAAEHQELIATLRPQMQGWRAQTWGRKENQLGPDSLGPV
ncbi:hypothetical protein [Longimicrobium terrae]|uniref:Tetratricopeptide (TPR) repeat protein n=1 Tax=Longimicrobium terrae TaxID=1639882 RepID=A0A841GWU4_9BACT|nr:hypothetical protein [Longimicrobium terrae]MBB4635917.1 tetratricopeptide (TPR) repeat protein [Longimicrobium terrae]MBB6070313.1 tetratricopeptide (TPR) repeat protein [Longimicrobium terrae]NNC30815.1 hypothetical protein [Longimicrobium terrae]